MATISTYVGVDHSLSACGFAEIVVRDGQIASHRAATVGTDPVDGLSSRLGLIGTAFLEFIDWEKDPRFAIEGFAFGARFSRETMAMVVGAIRYAAAAMRPADPEFVTIPPATVKRVLVPEWHGFSLDNWTAAGRTTKFKRSMPPKEDVIAGLFRLYGINCLDDAQADATGVAIAAAIKNGRLPAQYPDNDTPTKKQVCKTALPRQAVPRRNPKPKAEGQSPGLYS